MKYLTCITLLLSVVVFAADECEKQNCPDQYSACHAQVFGCSALSQKCKNKCKSYNQCMHDCAYEGGNQKFIDLYECAKDVCATEQHKLQNGKVCVELFNSECAPEQDDSTTCALRFILIHPECSFIKFM